MQKLAAMRQAACEKLNGVTPLAAAAAPPHEPSSASAPTLTVAPLMPAAPAAFRCTSTDDFLAAEASVAAPPVSGGLDLMDAPICFAGSAAPSLLALPSQQGAAPTEPASFGGAHLLEPVPSAPPSSGHKRRSPTRGLGLEAAASAGRPAATPTRAGRWTPAKLVRGEGVDSVKSGRKVQFKFPSLDAESGPAADLSGAAEGRMAPDDEGADHFPTFALPSGPLDKENGGHPAPAPAATATTRGLRKPASGASSALNTAVGTNGAAAKVGKSTFSFEPVAAPVQTSLGGAARVLVGGKASRAARQSLGGSGISKRPPSGRRSTISSLMGVPDASIKRISRPAWQ